MASDATMQYLMTGKVDANRVIIAGVTGAVCSAASRCKSSASRPNLGSTVDAPTARPVAVADDYVDDAARSAGKAADSAPKTKSEILTQNKINGRNFEIEKYSKLKATHSNAEEQITIVTNGGTKFRIDGMAYDEVNDQFVLQEYKSSATARLTNNQKKGFKELSENGGRIVGEGKGKFLGGTYIPAGTGVSVIRPN